MPNVGTSKVIRWKLLASVVISQTLYEAKVWADKMNRLGVNELTKMLKKIALRIVLAYRMMFNEASQVLADYTNYYP